MNPNPYPQGRWTQIVANSASRKSRSRLMPEPVSSLVAAPLKELFWGIPESRLLEEAKERIDHAVSLAISTASFDETSVQQELAVA